MGIKIQSSKEIKYREVAANILEKFENTLAEDGIKPFKEDLKENKLAAIIYGEEYYNLEDDITFKLEEVMKADLTKKERKDEMIKFLGEKLIKTYRNHRHSIAPLRLSKVIVKITNDTFKNL